MRLLGFLMLPFASALHVVWPEPDLPAITVLLSSAIKVANPVVDASDYRPH